MIPFENAFYLALAIFGFVGTMTPWSAPASDAQKFATILVSTVLLTVGLIL